MNTNPAITAAPITVNAISVPSRANEDVEIGVVVVVPSGPVVVFLLGLWYPNGETLLDTVELLLTGNNGTGVGVGVGVGE